MISFRSCSRAAVSLLLLFMLITPAPTTRAQEEATAEPTSPPTEAPTEVVTELPTEVPTEPPTAIPTELSTEAPTGVPTESPTETPTNVPTIETTPEPLPTGEATTESTPVLELTAEATLETLLGAPETLVARVEPITDASLMAARVFVVNHAGDAADLNLMDVACDAYAAIGNQCTLRAALQNANLNTDKDTVNFNIPGTGPHTITPGAEVMGNLVVTQPVIINGASEPGYTWGTPQIVLSGSSMGVGPGLYLTDTAPGSTIKGLVIIGGWDQGIRVDSANNLIQANFIGMNATGLAPDPNGDGIFLFLGGAANNTIGGTTAALRNLISGNSENGILLGGDSNGTRVQGNYIGTDKTGTYPRPNGIGVGIGDSPGNIIGGTVAGARNVISGNSDYGIYLLAAGSSGNRVQGNYIGTNPAGTLPVAGTQWGVYVGDAPNNVIGGTVAGARNLISGNGGHGVVIFNGGATGNVVAGNSIGTNAAGTADLGNNGSGVLIQDASNNVIGGTVAGAGNRIAYNTTYGIAVADSIGFPALALGNRLLSNLIYANDALGIDLGIDGVTLNDWNVDDADTGANNLQNHPVLWDMRGSRFAGYLQTNPNQAYRVQFFASPTCDSSGWGEGQRYLGTAAVFSDGNGDAYFNLTLPVTVTAGWRVSATATNQAGDTSEFAQCIIANLGIPVLVSPANGAITSDTTPIFDWNNVVGAPDYQIQIAYDPGFQTLVRDDFTMTSDYTPPPLTPSETYYWRVRAQGPGSQLTPWSATRRLNVIP